MRFNFGKRERDAIMAALEFYLEKRPNPEMFDDVEEVWCKILDEERARKRRESVQVAF